MPKLAPGQAKDDPNHGFRVCVNALINKCIKPDASTIPLAVDEIKKLANCTYFLQLDGANAYWSIPVCEESKRLTAFHTPDGIYCWNRLLMGAKPSSAVQQSAYLEALDDYIDYYEDGTIRKCLLDSRGNRLKDAEGNLKTLRHKFAVYCDDICAGADSIEELYELFEALICCCKRAGIQVKASKTKFGVEKVTFHNYTITKEGTQPKDANLCPIRNMEYLGDVSQVRAFLGCCQQMSQYIKNYGIIAAPLHALTKKAVAFPKPWKENEVYSKAFRELKAAILDTENFLHHKDPLKRLFLEVDASDSGWGACAYQLVEEWVGDPAAEGRGRQEHTGPRQVIQWTSKAWTPFELKLPVFYRESLARLLALEKYRNLIETNIEAGITLYTDHKPGLFENSLSNKGQLSAWRLLETADLLSIVENLYRTGGKMLLADPLSRICAPSDGFYDVELPAKIHALLQHLPEEVAVCKTVRVSANKDTAAMARMVQKWRKPTNPVGQGRLTSYTEMSGESSSTEEMWITDSSSGSIGLKSFSIGAPHADVGVREIQDLIRRDRAFAILTPLSLIPQISRGTTGHEEDDDNIARKVDNMTKIIMAATADVWLINLPGLPRRHEVLTMEQLDDDTSHVVELLQTLTGIDAKSTPTSHGGKDERVDVSLSFLLQSRLDLNAYRRCRRQADEQMESSSLLLPVLVSTRAGISQEAAPQRVAKSKMARLTARVPLNPLSSWIGKQLVGQTIPKHHLDENGILSTILEGFPNGLLAIPPTDSIGPRIVVPKDEQRNLITATHAEIHHQGHTKVLHILYPLYYWPGMHSDIENVCTTCETCIKATRRRKKLKMVFKPMPGKPLLLPRERYGIDFYGLQDGEILVIVDLFSRETFLEYLPNRQQDGVCAAILKRVVYANGVPKQIRSDNAPELMQGIVRQLCAYLDVSQVVTGGHNPRGNSICERVNQTLGAMIRKLSDLEYKDLRLHLPAFEFVINTTLNSATKRTPFEIAHGLPARTIAQARIEAQLGGRGGTDPDMLEDVSPTFDSSLTKSILELAMELVTEVRSITEWHRRMTHEHLNQSGRVINLDKLAVGTDVYFYKPPTVQDVKQKGRKAKHLDHYVGPARITKKIGDRSFQIAYRHPENNKEQLFQREAGMLILKKEMNNFTVREVEVLPMKHIAGKLPRKGEMVIMKDFPESTDWYLAEIAKVLNDRFVVNGYITEGAPLANYKAKSWRARKANLEKLTFHRTWCVNQGRGKATIIPPAHLKGQQDYLWKWRIPIVELDQILLVRDVILTADGKLSPGSLSIAAGLQIPHHVGAGGD